MRQRPGVQNGLGVLGEDGPGQAAGGRDRVLVGHEHETDESRDRILSRHGAYLGRNCRGAGIA